MVMPFPGEGATLFCVFMEGYWEGALWDSVGLGTCLFWWTGWQGRAFLPPWLLKQGAGSPH